MQVRMDAFTVSDDDRRALQWVLHGRKTMVSREDAKRWIEDVVEVALRDARYRYHGPKTQEAIANGADPKGIASYEGTSAAG